MTEVLGYHHLSLSVTDLGKSTEWYQQELGLDVAAEIEGDGHLTRPGVGEPFTERRAGMDHVAFQVDGVEAVEAMKIRFEELGVTH